MSQMILSILQGSQQTLISLGTLAVAAIAAYFSIKTSRLKVDVQAKQMKLQDEQREIQQRQRDALRDMEEFSSQFMTYALKLSPQAQASFHPMPGHLASRSSLFEVRRAHFGPEKEHLADAVVRKIQAKLIADEQLCIILILDGGSTVFPIFRKLCENPSFRFDKSLARRLSLITNNLPGVSDLTTFGRIGDKRSAKTLFRCRVLGGFADSSYEAALSEESAEELKGALKGVRKSFRDDCDKVLILSATTGNYLSIPDGILTRNPQHEEIKREVINVADEVFILAPLGKVMPSSAEDVNRMMSLQGEARYGSEVAWSSFRDKLHVIATTRPDKYFGVIRPAALGIYLGHAEESLRECFGDKLTEIVFDPMDSIRVKTEAAIVGKRRAFREYELPHRDLRESLLKKLER